MSKIVLKNGSTIAFTGDGDKLTGCQPDWVMRHLIYDGLTDEMRKIQFIMESGEMSQLVDELGPAPDEH